MLDIGTRRPCGPKRPSGISCGRIDRGGHCTDVQPSCDKYKPVPVPTNGALKPRIHFCSQRSVALADHRNVRCARQTPDPNSTVVETTGRLTYWGAARDLVRLEELRCSGLG